MIVETAILCVTAIVLGSLRLAGRMEEREQKANEEDEFPESEEQCAALAEKLGAARNRAVKLSDAAGGYGPAREAEDELTAKLARLHVWQAKLAELHASDRGQS